MGTRPPGSTLVTVSSTGIRVYRYTILRTGNAIQQRIAATCDRTASAHRGFPAVGKRAVAELIRCQYRPPRLFAVSVHDNILHAYDSRVSTRYPFARYGTDKPLRFSVFDRIYGRTTHARIPQSRLRLLLPRGFPPLKHRVFGV